MKIFTTMLGIAAIFLGIISLLMMSIDPNWGFPYFIGFLWTCLFWYYFARLLSKKKK